MKQKTILLAVLALGFSTLSFAQEKKKSTQLDVVSTTEASSTVMYQHAKINANKSDAPVAIMETSSKKERLLATYYHPLKADEKALLKKDADVAVKNTVSK